MALLPTINELTRDIQGGGQVANVYNTLTNQALNQRKQELANRYYGPNIESEIANRQALTEGQNIANQYSPERLRLANEAAQMTNQYNLQMNPLNIEKQRQLNQLNQQINPFKIEEERIRAANFEASEKARIASLEALARNRSINMGNLGAGGKEEQNFQRFVSMDNPQLGNDPDKIYEASNVLRLGGDHLSDGTPLNQMSPAAQGALDRVIKYNNSAQGLNQKRFAATVETAIQNADQNVQGALKYSGLLGNAQGSADRAIQLLGGESSPDYQAFNNFVKVDVPTIAGEYMRALGVNASDEQKRMYKEVVNPINWYTNPNLALSQWNYFKQLAHSIAKTVAQSPSQIERQLAGNREKESSEKTYSQKDLEFTAKKYNMTIDQVKQKLGIK